MAFNYAVVLTGSIATGKSSVVKFFLEDGFSIIDADKIAHEMLDLHSMKIEELFGSHYVNNSKVDRKALGKLIFSSSQKKKELESLLHPLIFEAIEKEAIRLDRLKECYIVDIPLFFESNRYPIKESIVVYTPKKLQLKRLMARDGSTKEEALLRINSQIDIEEKIKKATYIIDNSKDWKYLQQEYGKVKEKILFNFKELP